MGNLKFIVFVLWMVLVMVELFDKTTFYKFLHASIWDAVFLGCIYVILHFVVKHW